MSEITYPTFVQAQKCDLSSQWDLQCDLQCDICHAIECSVTITVPRHHVFHHWDTVHADDPENDPTISYDLCLECEKIARTIEAEDRIFGTNRMSCTTYWSGMDSFYDLLKSRRA